MKQEEEGSVVELDPGLLLTSDGVYFGVRVLDTHNHAELPLHW